MDRATRLLLVFTLGLTVGFLAAFLLWLTVGPIPADAQGVGVFGTSATGTRLNCAQIASAVPGQTFCFDQSTNALYGWDPSGNRVLMTFATSSDNVGIGVAPNSTTQLLIGSGTGTNTYGLRVTNGIAQFDASLAVGTGVTVGNGVSVGATGVTPGTGFVAVASGVNFNATQVLWNGANSNQTPRCTNNCGTSPSVAGTNSAMRVTMGSTGTPRSPFLVLFNGTWNTAPSCIAQLGTSTTTTVSVTNTTTTGVQVNTTIGPSQGGIFHIQCLGVG